MILKVFSLIIIILELFLIIFEIYHNYKMKKLKIAGFEESSEEDKRRLNSKKNGNFVYFIFSNIYNYTCFRISIITIKKLF